MPCKVSAAFNTGFCATFKPSALNVASTTPFISADIVACPSNFSNRILLGNCSFCAATVKRKARFSKVPANEPLAFA